MDKHITLVGVLNIAYRALLMVVAGGLSIFAFAFEYVFDGLVRSGGLGPDDVPFEILQIIPIVLLIIAGLIFVVSVAAIVGSIGVLQKKEWGRILVLAASFFNLLHIPIGTALGAYSIWVLMNDETLKLFRRDATPPAGHPMT